VDADPVNNAYLRFDVKGLQGPVTAATLRLFPTIAGNVRGVDLRGVADNSWGETTLTASNAPAASGTIAAHIGAYDANVPIALDAKSLVSGNGSVSMAITTTSTASRSFSARESATNPPQLIVQATDVTVLVVGVTTPADGGSTGGAPLAFSGTAGPLQGDLEPSRSRSTPAPSRPGSRSRRSRLRRRTEPGRRRHWGRWSPAPTRCGWSRRTRTAMSA
jgi:acid phosphatase type 7